MSVRFLLILPGRPRPRWGLRHKGTGNFRLLDPDKCPGFFGKAHAVGKIGGGTLVYGGHVYPAPHQLVDEGAVVVTAFGGPAKVAYLAVECVH